MNTAAPTGSRTRVISSATIAWIAAIAALTLANWYCLGIVDEEFTGVVPYNVAYWFGNALNILLTVLTIGAAVRVGLHENVGKIWLLVGLAVAAYTVGDIVWTIIELHLGRDPYPGVSDVFYTLEYVFLFWAMLRAICSYRGLVSLRTPGIISSLLGLVGVAIIYTQLLAKYIFPSAGELGFWSTVVNTFYPVGDVVLMLVPAIMLALVIRQLGAGRLGWPWWIVVASSFVLAVSDTAYSHRDWAGLPSTSLLDSGWVVSLALLAIASLVARDVYRSR